MATCNYKRLDYGLPLVVLETEDWRYEVEIEDAEQMIDELDLRYFHVKITDGYYAGVQVDVQDTSYTGYDCETSDEEAKYFYGLTARTLKEQMNKELKKIRKLCKQLKEQGWMELELQGVFSNGEGVYKIVE